ncbi:hypothetical protein [Xenorhabdus bovienii]|uniref:hypothetical protein n=1 Tax=Xenorhabdus bovienii TaxID=40576 RepID=UPI0023B34D9C|nr:hypothetical protein [Xenorhabdus bovienii]
MFCGLLLPLLSGGCCNFMPPVHLISEPFRWLKIIHDYQANSVAAPDFAWELCASMVTDEGITQLDLSSVKMAMNAADPSRDYEPVCLPVFGNGISSAKFYTGLWHGRIDFSPINRLY